MKVRKKGMSLVVLGIMLIFISGCGKIEGQTVAEVSTSNNEDVITLSDGTIIYPDGTMKLALGASAWGMYDFSGNLLHNGDILPVRNDRIAGKISFFQNLPREKTEYALIILVDYEMKYFSVEGKTYSDYRFTLAGEDSIDINIELALPENAKVLTQLIVFEPGLKELAWEGEGCADFLDTTIFYATSYCLREYQYDEADYVFCNDLKKSASQNMSIFMAKDLEEPMVMPTCNSGDEVKIFLGNGGLDIETTYLMIAFLNWEQSLIEGEPYKIFKLTGAESYYYDLTVPEVDEASPYQVFLLENPFRHRMGDYYTGTLRTIIQSK